MPKNPFLFKNATVGTSVIQVKAFDADDGLNAEIEYSFKDKKEVRFSTNVSIVFIYS